MSNAKEIVTLLEKTGRMALCNQSVPIPKPDLVNLISSLSISEIGTYLKDLEDPFEVDMLWLQHGLVEISEQYFRMRSINVVATELVNAICPGLPRKERVARKPASTEEPAEAPLFSDPLPNLSTNETVSDTNTDTGIGELDAIRRDIGKDQEPNVHVDDECGAIRRDVSGVPESIAYTVTDDLVTVQREFSDVHPPTENVAVELDANRLMDQLEANEELFALPERTNSKIDLTERDLHMQQLDLEEHFPLPERYPIDDGFGENIESGEPHGLLGIPDQDHLSLPQTPTNARRARRGGRAHRRRRIRSIADLDPSYRPPRIARPRPQPSTPVTWNLNIANIQRRLLEEDVAAARAPQIVPISDVDQGHSPPEIRVSEVRTEVQQQQPVSLPQIIISDHTDRQSLNVAVADMPSALERPSLMPMDDKHLSTDSIESNRHSLPFMPIQGEQSTPKDKSLQSAQRIETPNVSAIYKRSLTGRISERFPLKTIIETSIGEPSRGPTLPSPSVLQAANIIDEDAEPIPIEPTPIPPYFLQPPDIEMGPFDPRLMSSYDKIAKLIVNNETELSMSELLGSASQAETSDEVCGAASFLALCNLHNKGYVRMETGPDDCHMTGINVVINPRDSDSDE